jgi:hypothetical protein
MDGSPAVCEHRRAGYQVPQSWGEGTPWYASRNEAVGLGRVVPSSFFLLPSSFFLLPSSFFLLPLIPPAFFTLI